MRWSFWFDAATYLLSAALVATVVYVRDVLERGESAFAATMDRGRAYAAHFALTHLFWLGTYPAVGMLSRVIIGTAATFTVAGVACLPTTAAAVLLRLPHGSHAVGRSV